MSDWFGVLPVLKPAGWTSHDVVAKIRRLLGIRKAGHTGTLDPGVAGVLPVCLGRATRAAEWIQEAPKTYEAAMRIGIGTDTEDLTGRIVERVDKAEITAEQIETALRQFRGSIEQVPPMYSAVKVQGKKLYELAREGKEVPRKPRTVHIHELVPLEMKLDLPHPEIRFRVTCSKGTYIRTLCKDIGKTLGYPAVMTDLFRTASGNIRHDQCLSMEEIERRHAAGQLADAIIPVDRALDHFGEVQLPPEWAQKAKNGVGVPVSVLAFTPEPHALYKVYDEWQRFIGVFRHLPERRRLKAEKLFV